MRELDPNNKWLYKIAMSPAEVAERRKMMAEFNEVDKYTCDDCSQAPICTLAFDSYNTNGDCLYEK